MAAGNSLSGYEYYRELKEILSSRDAYRLAYMSNWEFQRDIGQLVALQHSLRSSIHLIQGNMSMYDKMTQREKDMIRRNAIQSIIDGLGLGDQFSVESVWNDKRAQQGLIAAVEAFIPEVAAVAKEAGRMRWSYFQYDAADSEDKNAIRDAKAAAQFLLDSCKDAYESGTLNSMLAGLLNGNSFTWERDRRQYDNIVRCAVLLRGKMSSDYYKIVDRADFFGWGLEEAEKIADRVIKFHYKDRTIASGDTVAGYERNMRETEDRIYGNATSGGALGRMRYVPEGATFAESGLSVAELASMALLANYKIYVRSVWLRRKSGNPAALVAKLNAGDAEGAKALLGGLPRRDMEEAYGYVDEIVGLRQRAARLRQMAGTLAADQVYEFKKKYVEGAGSGVNPLWEPNYESAKNDIAAQEAQASSPVTDDVLGQMESTNGNVGQEIAFFERARREADRIEAERNAQGGEADN